MIDQPNHMNQQALVRRLLRSKSSQQYFTGSGWTSDTDEARTYTDSFEAAQTCAQWGLSNIEIVLRLSDADLFCTELCVARDGEGNGQT